MHSILIIWAGWVWKVTTHKCAMNRAIFSNITLASKTLSKCEEIKNEIKEMWRWDINIEQIDANDVSATVQLIKKCKAELLINVALPYQDLVLMDACLEAWIHYLDTANYEPEDIAKFEYSWQWEYFDKFKEKWLMALLGSWFDPWVTNVFCAYAQQNLFDEIHSIDILDANGGDHGYPFATNFNPEINIREITQKWKYWENWEWIEIDSMSQHKTFDFDWIWEKEMYLLYHEELESLVNNIKWLKKIRFWMTFSQNYLTHLKVLENVWMTRIDYIDYEWKQISPIQFLKAVLPNPSDLWITTKWKTNIWCIINWIVNWEKKTKYIYNICSHEDAYKEVKSQAISYTAWVPPVIWAMMMLNWNWMKSWVFNVEEFNAKPFMDELNIQWLPWVIKELPSDFII